jgi:hypothetical protein
MKGPMKSCERSNVVEAGDGASTAGVVIQAYTVSCLVLTAVLLWTVGDAWCEYAAQCLYVRVIGI